MSSPKLRPPQIGQLPTADREYRQSAYAALLNTLRIYFNQIENTFGALLGTLGGRFLSAPYGALVRTTTQTAAAADTAYRVEAAAGDALGITAATGRLTVANSGVYRMHAWVQLRNQDAAAQAATLWVRTSAGDASDSSRAVFLAAGASVGGALEWSLSLEADAYVELWWVVSDTQVELVTTAAVAVPYVAPRTPAVTIALSFVSAIVA